jgi:hypothetical protein
MAIEAGSKASICRKLERPVRLPSELGFDAAMVVPDIKERPWVKAGGTRYEAAQCLFGRIGIPHVVEFAELVQRSLPKRHEGVNYPCVIMPGTIHHVQVSGASPIVILSQNIFVPCFSRARQRGTSSTRSTYYFLKSWNEWAEGNHLEPDLKYGKDYLRVVAEIVAPDEPATSYTALAQEAGLLRSTLSSCTISRRL